jgi:hypothetical protein
MQKTILLLLLGFYLQSNAQQPPLEFDKGWVLNLELLQGFSKAKKTPELYLADVRLSPQWTIAPGILRAGITGGLLYNNTKLAAFAGPNAALNIKTLKTKPGSLNGSILNVQLLVEHLWGTEQQRLLGGGLRTEIGKMLLLSILTHRDYNLNYWNVEFGVGINFIRKKLGTAIN